MLIREIVDVLESWAPPALQESYDNSGFLAGSLNSECTGILCSLDLTLEVLNEAIAKNCNLVVSHHPIIFKGLRSVTDTDPVGALIMKAVESRISIMAVHTNLDNLIGGVNGMIAEKLGLGRGEVLAPSEDVLRKLVTYAPHAYREQVQEALFAAGAGHIGNYSECSFVSPGTGTFLAGEGSDPFVGEIGKRREEPESRIEVIYPVYLEKAVLAALRASHPYEEIAHEIYIIKNKYKNIGAGWIGDLPKAVPASEFLKQLSETFRIPTIRHTELHDKILKRIAFCGGAGGFLIQKALKAGADLYFTSDLKYHDFFIPRDRMILADIGHFESEQFTTDLIQRHLQQKFPNFAVLKTSVSTNPVKYFQSAV